MNITQKTLIIFGTLAAMLTAGCSTTRRIPEGEVLYTGVKEVKYTPKENKKKGEPVPAGLEEQVAQTVNVAPNNSLISPSIRYPFPLGLWVYNNWNPDAKGLKGWLYNKLVKEPVLISDVRPEVRVKMIDEILDNNGYFRGSANYKLNYAKNPKKATITYEIDPGDYYPIDTIEYLPDSVRLYALIDSVAKADPYLQPGTRYSTDSLSVVRNRITNAVRDRGYYFFRPEFLEYLADSLQHRGKIAMRLSIAKNIPAFVLDQYRTGNITVIANRNKGYGTPDTVKLRKGTLIQMMPSRLRRAVIDECLAMRKGSIFTVRSMNRTQNYFSRLGIFNQIDITVHRDTLSHDSVPKLDVLVNLTFDAPIEASLEVNASSKSNSYIGPGIIAGVTNRNIFGGGEQLSVNVNGTYEWQTGHDGAAKNSIFNSYELGINASLAFPRLLAPKFIPRSRRNQLNWTRISIGADALNRPHYFKLARFNSSFSYDWQASRYVKNSLTLFKLTYTKLMHTTEVFDSICAQNPAIALSFRSQFIPQIAYTFMYDRAIDRNQAINYYVTVQEAGNIFSGVWSLLGWRGNGEKKLFGTPFSQFVKLTSQVVYSHRVRNNDWLVGRFLIGAAHAYGNSSQVPYSEQFYIGGANSIRAFTVRSLGPGSYRAPSGLVNGYFDQTGTFKLEANLEYRFPIVGILHGAVFLDSGNIWLLKNDPDRPGGQLKAKTFLKDIALGTGAGLRVDISMFVIRGDLGIGLHAPYDTGERGYFNMPSFWKSLAFHLAIGYPF